MQSLKDLREARGLTRAELAERAGLSVATVFRAETARVMPNVGTLKLITDALRVRPAEVSR